MRTPTLPKSRETEALPAEKLVDLLYKIVPAKVAGKMLNQLMEDEEDE